MLRKTVVISNKLGLHARAAAKLVNVASQFESMIFLEHKDQQADAKSIMGIMMLAASQGTQLDLIIDGPDENEACRATTELIDDFFGENE